MPKDSQPVVGAIVFSLVGDAVWASWPGKSVPVELGRHDTVAYMMRDFLAQCDLVDRLSHYKASNG